MRTLVEANRINEFELELELAFKNVLKVISRMPHCGSDEHLVGTSGRLARAYVEDFFSGLFEDPDEIFKRGIWEPLKGSNQMVWVREIDFVSFCAHHILPFTGKVHVAYVPKIKMVGLSKVPRVIEVYSRRPQLQERLTEQLADCYMRNLEPHGVGVMVEAEHQCMSCRGVRKPGAITVTTALRGCFEEGSTKEEFLLGANQWKK